jgi:hypothetical protein
LHSGAGGQGSDNDKRMKYGIPKPDNAGLGIFFEQLLLKGEFE